MTKIDEFSISLFVLVQQHLGGSIPLIRCSKATLVHISHALEDVILTNRIPAMIFTGFQESTHWKAETARYRKLADVAMQVCIFAGKQLPPESEANQLHIALSGDDPLRQEWFLIILSDVFSVLLCGQDCLKPTLDEATREFDTLWTFNPIALNPVLDLLEDAVRHYRPERLEALQAARSKYTLQAPEAELITQLTANLLAYEENLQHELLWQQSLVETLLATISQHLYVEEISADGFFTIIYESPNEAYLLETDFHTVDRQDWLIRHIYPQDQAAYQQHMARLVAGEDSRLDFRVQQHSQRVAWLRDIAHVKASDKGMQRVYGVLENITEQKELEASRREQERLRLELERERQFSIIRNYFMTTVSHEFRTPLATIYSASEILSRYHDRVTTDDRLSKLGSIQQEVKHIITMLDGITHMIDEQIDHVVSEPIPLRLADYINNVIRTFQAEKPTEHKILLHYESHTGPVVMAHPHLIRTILENLLSNAVSYSSNLEPIHVNVYVEDYTVQIQMIDQGIGIPQADQSQIFMPFHRGSNVHKIPGVGLGLDIVRTCVELHAGTVTFSSIEGQGATFLVRLGISPAK